MKERIWIRFRNLSKSARIKRGVTLCAEACISAVCLIMAVVYGVNGDPYNRLFTCLMTGLLLWMPIAVERIAKHRFSFTQHLAFIILLAGGQRFLPLLSDGLVRLLYARFGGIRIDDLPAHPALQKTDGDRRRLP